MQNCEIGNDLVCVNCGRKASRRDVVKPCTAGGLGDMTAAALSAVGITETRAERLAKWAGLSGCGCSGRRAAMNRLGQEWLGIGKPDGPGLTPVQDQPEPDE